MSSCFPTAQRPRTKFGYTDAQILKVLYQDLSSTLFCRGTPQCKHQRGPVQRGGPNGVLNEGPSPTNPGLQYCKSNLGCPAASKGPVSLRARVPVWRGISKLRNTWIGRCSPAKTELLIDLLTVRRNYLLYFVSVFVHQRLRARVVGNNNIITFVNRRKENGRKGSKRSTEYIIDILTQSSLSKANAHQSRANVQVTLPKCCTKLKRDMGRETLLLYMFRTCRSAHVFFAPPNISDLCRNRGSDCSM